MIDKWYDRLYSSFNFDLIDHLQGGIGLHIGWLRVNGQIVFHYKAFWTPKLFSERYGYVKYHNFGLFRIRFGGE